MVSAETRRPRRAFGTIRKRPSGRVQTQLSPKSAGVPNLRAYEPRMIGRRPI